MSNIYLEKIREMHGLEKSAGLADFYDDLTGSSYKHTTAKKKALEEAIANKETVHGLGRKAKVLRNRMFKTRAITGGTALGVAATGLAAVHGYNNYRQNKILNSIYAKNPGLHKQASFFSSALNTFKGIGAGVGAGAGSFKPYLASARTQAFGAIRNTGRMANTAFGGGIKNFARINKIPQAAAASPFAARTALRNRMLSQGMNFQDATRQTRARFFSRGGTFNSSTLGAQVRSTTNQQGIYRNALNNRINARVGLAGRAALGGAAIYGAKQMLTAPKQPTYSQNYSSYY